MIEIKNISPIPKLRTTAILSIKMTFQFAVGTYQLPSSSSKGSRSSRTENCLYFDAISGVEFFCPGLELAGTVGLRLEVVCHFYTELVFTHMLQLEH